MAHDPGTDLDQLLAHLTELANSRDNVTKHSTYPGNPGLGRHMWRGFL
jgi:hypothetical protein